MLKNLVKSRKFVCCILGLSVASYNYASLGHTKGMSSPMSWMVAAGVNNSFYKSDATVFLMKGNSTGGVSSESLLVNNTSDTGYEFSVGLQNAKSGVMLEFHNYGAFKHKKTTPANLSHNRKIRGDLYAANMFYKKNMLNFIVAAKVGFGYGRVETSSNGVTINSQDIVKSKGYSLVAIKGLFVDYNFSRNFAARLNFHAITGLIFTNTFLGLDLVYNS